MGTSLFGLAAVGLLFWLVVALVRAQNKNTELARRVTQTETDLGNARRAFDALAGRLWHVERALGELHRASRGEAPEKAKGSPELAQAAATEWWKPIPGAAKLPALSPGTPVSPFLVSASPSGAEGAPPTGKAPAAVAARSPDLAGATDVAAALDPAKLEGRATSEVGATSDPGRLDLARAPDTAAAPPGAENPGVGATADVGATTDVAPTADAGATADVAPPAPAGPAAPPPPTTAPPVSPYPPQTPGNPPFPAPRPPIEWERWIGVRGAAALGAGILVIAALYFFKYSIEQGLISPGLRVVTGTVVGLVCVAGSERSLRAKHLVLANWLAGAGVAILYAAFWAAHTVYGLIGTVPAFGLMIAVTAACVLLAIRHGSLVTAVLGLLGGFITPFALSSGDDHPIALFGYLLLLDVALIGVARTRRWPLLAALSLAGTWLYQIVWISQRMGPDRLALGTGILLVFAAVFALGTSALAAPAAPAADPLAPGAAPRPAPMPLSQPAAVLVPIAFGLYFGLRSDLDAGFLPVAFLLAVLAAGACWVSYVRREGWVAFAAATASVAVVFAWILRHDPYPVTLQLIGLVLLLAAVFHVALELGERRSFAPPPRSDAAPPNTPVADTAPLPSAATTHAARAADIASFSRAAAVASLGALFLLFMAASWPSCVSPWPWLAASALLTGLTLRHAGFAGREPLHMGVAALLGLGLPILHLVHADDLLFPDSTLYLGLCAAVAAALLGLSFLRRDDAGRRWSGHAAALAPLLLLIEPLAIERGAPPAVVLAVTLLLGGLAAVSATRLGSGAWFSAAMLVTALVQTIWTAVHMHPVSGAPATSTLLPALLVSAVVFTAWPLLARRKFAESPWAFRAAALAGPAWFGALDHVWRTRLGDSAIGLVPAGLGALALAAALAAWRQRDTPEPTQRLATTWFAAMAIAFVTIAIPFQLSNEGITLGWSIEALALIALFRRIDHAGLKYTGLALFAVVTLRLVANPAVVEYHPHASVPVVNWLLYTYGVPAACLLAAWRLLGDIEVERLRPREKAIYTRPLPLTAMACALAAIVVLFVWLNLTILDAFNAGRDLDLLFEHHPARDLTLSIAWALYALALLALGMRRGNAGLRWASLVLILVTVGKVFLYDLGHLEDLYRVASLVGLALSLILISVAYQRLVFRKTPPPAP